MVVTADPRPLFTLLTETLGLPVAWPISGFGSFRSGGVWVGNTNLEVFEDERQIGTARFGGIAFEPAPLTSALTALKARGIAVGRENHAGPFRLGDAAVEWTTAPLPSLSMPGLLVFLCEYTRPDVRAFRMRLDAALRRSNGGALGIDRVDALVIGSGGDESYADQWRRFADAADDHGPLTLRLHGGPRVTVDPALPRGMHALVLRVASLDRAARVLENAGLLGSRSADTLTIARDRVGGLDIRIVGP